MQYFWHCKQTLVFVNIIYGILCNSFIYFKVGITCIAKHPSQNHIIGSGSQDGKISFWDLRQQKFPMTIMKGHSQAVNEVIKSFNEVFKLYVCVARVADCKN